MTVPIEITQSVKEAIEAERRRIVGIVLRAYGEARAAGELAIADVLDRLATEIEKS